MIRSEGLGFKSSPRYYNGQLRLSVFLFCTYLQALPLRPTFEPPPSLSQSVADCVDIKQKKQTTEVVCFE